MSARKSTQMRTPDTTLIPELEEAIAQGNTGKFGTFWSKKEEEILENYYGRVDTRLLLKHLPGKTKAQIQSKAARMGITNRGGH